MNSGQWVHTKLKHCTNWVITLSAAVFWLLSLFHCVYYTVFQIGVFDVCMLMYECVMTAPMWIDVSNSKVHCYSSSLFNLTESLCAKDCREEKKVTNNLSFTQEYCWYNNTPHNSTSVITNCSHCVVCTIWYVYFYHSKPSGLQSQLLLYLTQVMRYVKKKWVEFECCILFLQQAHREWRGKEK